MNIRPVIAVVVIGALAVGGYLIDRSRAQQESVLSGYFENQPTIAASRLGGRVTQILVREGDAIKKGQALVRLEDKSYADTYEAQKMAAEQAKQQYDETAIGPRQEEIARQAAVVREAEAAYRRLANGPLPEEIRSARQRLASAEAQYRKVQSGSRPEEIAAARAAANIALAKLRAAERGLTAEERGQLKARVDSATADENLASKNLDRAKFLYDQGAIPKQQLDTALATFQQAASRRKDAEEALLRAQRGTPPEELSQAREAYRQAQAQAELVRKGSRREDIESARQEALIAGESLKLLVKGSRKEDIDAAKARLDQARAVLTQLQNGSTKQEIAKAKANQQQAAMQAKSVGENLKERVVYATADGVVDRVMVADGDVVSAGTPIAQISQSGDIWVRVYVPEGQLQKIKVGDPAELAIDGVPGTVRGIVEAIASKGEFTPGNLQSPEDRGRQVFGVRIRLAQRDDRIKAGMYATVKKVGQWP